MPSRSRMSRAVLCILILLLLMPTTSMVTRNTESIQSLGHNETSAITFSTDLARSVYEGVSLESYRSLVRELSEMGPRPFGSQGNRDASDWILEKISNFTNNRVNGIVTGAYDNIIAKLSGRLGSNGPAVVVGAHFDSVEVSPGANDDGSGVAATLELLRVLSKHYWPLDIYFCFWNDEESGLHGSNEIAKEFHSDEIDILIYYNIDMLLMVDPTLPTSKKINMGYANEHGATFHDARYWAELTRVMGNNFDESVTMPIPSNEMRYWQYSDHASFESAGYHSVIFAFETGGDLDTAYHTENDVWDNPIYDYTYAAKAVASIGSSIAFALSREEGQKFYERHELVNLGVTSTKSILVEMSTQTTLGVNVTSDESSNLRIAFYDPAGNLLAFKDGSMSPGDVYRTAIQIGLDGTYRIDITNNGGQPADLTVELDYETDIDGDSELDSQRWWHNTFQDDEEDSEEEPEIDLTLVDEDNDTLSDYDEIYIYGTNPRSNDTDKDLIDDAFEIETGLDPLVADSHLDPDYDGLSNLREYLLGTDLFSRDSDSDLIPDGWESDHGLDPLRDDAMEDPDGDTLENLYEYRAGLNPQVFDGPMLTLIPTGITATVILVAVMGWAIRGKARKR